MEPRVTTPWSPVKTARRRLWSDMRTVSLVPSAEAILLSELPPKPPLLKPNGPLPRGHVLYHVRREPGHQHDQGTESEPRRPRPLAIPSCPCTIYSYIYARGEGSGPFCPSSRRGPCNTYAARRPVRLLLLRDPIRPCLHHICCKRLHLAAIRVFSATKRRRICGHADPVGRHHARSGPAATPCGNGGWAP